MASGQRGLLLSITNLQRFDGSFNLDSQLASILGLNFDMIRGELQGKKWNAEGWATILVIVYFMNRLSSLEDDWELIANKSKTWLLQNHASQMDAMFECATTKFIPK